MAAADVHYSAASELLTDGPRLSFSPIHTVPATVVQVLAVCIYCVLVFVLPGVDPFFGTSNHLTVLHAGCWLVVSAVGFWVQRESTRILKTGYLKMYRRTHQLSIAPVVVCTVVNFLLLTLLGLDTWVEQETGDDPISKRVLQVASAVEAAVTLGLGSRYIFLVVRFNRERPPSETQLLTRQHARRMSLDEHGAAAAGYGAARSIPSLGDGSVDLGMDGSSRSDGARAQQLVAILMQQIEVLTADTDRLNNEVTAAHTGKGSTHKRLTDLDAECSRLREQARQELLRYTRAQDEIGALREELRRTGTELRSAREALQQEKRRSEKLSLTLNIERVATRKAQAAIDGMMYASATEAETTLGNTMAAILGTGAGSRPGPSPLRETGRRPTHPSLNGDGDDDDDDSDYGILGDDPAGSAPDGSAATEGLVRQMMERAARSGDRPATGGGAGAGGTDDA